MPLLQIGAASITDDAIRTALLLVVLVVLVLASVALRRIQVNALELRAKVAQLQLLLSFTLQSDPNGPRRRRTDVLCGELEEAPPIDGPDTGDPKL